MSEHDEGTMDKLTREAQEKGPTEAVRDDLAGGKTGKATEATEDQEAELQRERESDQSATEAAEKHWPAGS